MQCQSMTLSLFCFFFWPCSWFHVCKWGERTISSLIVSEFFWSSSGCECACLYTHRHDGVPDLATRAFRCWDNANNKKIRVDLCPCMCGCLISIQKALLSIGCRNIYCMPNMCFTLTNTIYVIDLFIYLHLILKKKVSDHPFSRLHQAAVPDTPPPLHVYWNEFKDRVW